jgi:hypothetical protein
MAKKKSNLLVQLNVGDLEQLIKDAVKAELEKVNDIIPSHPKSDSNQLFTQEEASKILDLSIDMLNHMTKAGLLPTKKIEGRVYYQRRNIMERLDCAPLPF